MNTQDAPLVVPSGLCNVVVRRQCGDLTEEAQDWVANEVPVALEYNGVSHAVMLATPADLEDFGLGFSFTEEIVGARSDVRDIEVSRGAHGITIHMEISSARFASLKGRRRSLAGRTGCGLCGTESLAQAVRQPSRVESSGQFAPAAVRSALEALRQRQPLHDATGSTHAAGFADRFGKLLLVREDVGRHNALDKLVGGLIGAAINREAGFVVVTSRASYEMVAKTARAGVGVLAAISGATALAIKVAEDAGLCLAGFARGDRLSLYTHAFRLEQAESMRACLRT